MGQIFVAACSALFVWLGVGIPAKILKHISVLHAVVMFLFYTIRKDRDTAGMDRYSSTSANSYWHGYNCSPHHLSQSHGIFSRCKFRDAVDVHVSWEGGEGPPNSSSVSRALLLKIQFSGPSLCFAGHSCEKAVHGKKLLHSLCWPQF